MKKTSYNVHAITAEYQTASNFHLYVDLISLFDVFV